ncbi:outer membrane protein OmpA-like peptidoglycan-associated protein [Streptomyces sp. CG 926]|uniref:OmpA family protein n=1 Tax=Streptomyces sp. CG 926 TaxID=1882405 RepID=UPI000D6D3CEB|nr:OmpA family protein [Streptomyces sp. CG 926]PWK67773.1 outer membrane protein OmpA-like peptidoglycan-associated protein [Streptomyces sp. CG 926]
MTTRHRTTASTVVVGLVIAGTHLIGATSAHADDVTPSVPPGTEPSASAPVALKPDSPRLKLPQGGTLAPPKVLDLVEVVEDLGGEQRRQETNQTVMMALQSEVLFPENSAVFNAQAAARIQAIANEINTQKATRIRVFGFTDDQGSYEHGQELSKQRADAVQAELAKTVTNPSVVFDVRGYSEDYPIADNSTEEGRKKNRRVEITFPRSAGG